MSNGTVNSFCENCISLKPSEEEQKSDKDSHVCTEWNKILFHLGFHPHIPRLLECVLKYGDSYPANKKGRYMDRVRIEQELKEKLLDSFGIDSEDQIKPESRFVEDLGFDSLDVVELVMWAETNFDMRIKDEDVKNILTVKEFVDYLEKTIK